MLKWLRRYENLAAVIFALVPLVFLLQFVAQYSVNFPRGDSSLRTLHVVVEVASGQLDWRDLFYAQGGHVTLHMMLRAVALTWWTGWNSHIETWTNVLFGVTAALFVVGFIARTDKRALAPMLVPASLILLSVGQAHNWLFGYTGAWFITQMFYIMSLAAVMWLPRSRWAFALALFLALNATFAHGQGFLTLGLMLPALWVRGYRHWGYYALWIAVAVPSVLFYYSFTDVVVGESEQIDVLTANVVDLTRPIGSLRLMVGLLGNLFESSEPNVSVSVGVAGLLMLVLNAAYVTFRQRDWQSAATWLIIAAYSLATAALIGLSRVQFYQQLGEPGFFRPYYTTFTGYFWIATLTLGVLVMVRDEGAAWYRTPLIVANLLLGGWLTLLYVPANIESLADDVWVHENETCHMQFVYTQDAPSLSEAGCDIWWANHMNILSYYELGLFYHMEPQQMLPVATTNDPIIIDGDDGWGNYHVAKWLLDGAENVIHITPNQPTWDGVDIPSLPNTVAPADADALTEYVGDSAGLWVVRRASLETSAPDFFASLSDAGYVSATTEYTTPEGVMFVVERWQLLELVTDTPITFGDQMRLVGWTSVGERLEACSTLTVRSVWERVDEPLLDGFSATLTLDRITGESVWDFETVARTDGQLTYTPTNAWENGALYVDERTLTIPCELPAGDYTVQLGVYNYRDNERLAPRIGDGEPQREPRFARIEVFAVE